MAKNFDEDFDLEKDIEKDADDYEEAKPKIQLNRKLRAWNKYKKYIIWLALIVILACSAGIALKISNGKKIKEDEDSATKQPQTIAMGDSTEYFTEKETGDGNEKPSQGETESATKATATGSTHDITGPVTVEEFTAADSYKNAVFVGDAFVSGVSYYRYLPEAQVVSDLSMSCENISKNMDKITALKPSAIYLMIGLNDLNYGTKTPEKISEEIADVVKQFKSALPSVEVKVLSVLPISSAFEEKTTVEVTQKNIDALNLLLNKNASTMGVSYIDCSTVFKAASTGYFSTDYTASGYNIKQEYYPFLLNAIAKIS